MLTRLGEMHSNTSHVTINRNNRNCKRAAETIQIHLMLLLIDWLLGVSRDRQYSNTSHVTINLGYSNPFSLLAVIQIHLMLLLIAFIICPLPCGKLIQIHLMLLLIQEKSDLKNVKLRKNQRHISR